MNELEKIVSHILDEHYNYSCRDTLDDVEMIKGLKFVLKGAENYLHETGQNEEKIGELIIQLKDYSKKKYMKEYINNFDEDADLSENEKSEEASYYFEYLYENEEHPY